MSRLAMKGSTVNQYLLLVHNDAAGPQDDDSWGPYLDGLQRSGHFDGGSAIGNGVSVTKAGINSAVLDQLVGYLVVRAESLEDAQRFVIGNPVFEAGGTIEIRELPRT